MISKSISLPGVMEQQETRGEEKEYMDDQMQETVFLFFFIHLIIIKI